MVKKEKHGDDEAGNNGSKDPGDFQVPKLYKEDGSIRACWPERGADL